MTFISYAQNYEDVMLWRALKHVQNGFYIDVGAWSPDVDSVTRAFYEKNWSGINIEPNPEFHSLYESRRPRDINKRVALGDKEGLLLINFMSNPGLSTAVEQFAEQHKSAGWTSNKQEVELTTLAKICSQNLSKDQQINFLKVDVEGLEEAVLRGNDWSLYRPWVVVVEATLPMSQVESYAAWEPILLAANYEFVYADGLNRFYVAHEHSYLREAFKYPPNVFDGFLLSTQQEAETKAQQAETKAQQAETKAQQAETKAQQAETKAQQAESKAQQAESKAQQAESKAQQAESIGQHYAATLNAVYASKSWRLTAPLRWIFGQARRLRHEGLKSRIKAFAKKALRKMNHELLLRPSLRQKLIGVSRRLGIHATLKTLLQKAHSQMMTHSASAISPLDSKVQDLSPRALQIYTQLQKNTNSNNNKGSC